MFTPTEGSPQSLLEVLIGPFLFAFFGLMLAVGVIKQIQLLGRTPKWWIGALLPTLLAIFLGFQRFMYRFDTGYFSTISSRKLDWAHFLAFLGPLFCLILTVALVFRQRKIEAQKVY